MVFDPVSWETHYASDHVAVILETIHQGRRSTTEIAEALCGGPPTEDESAALEEILRSLSDLGLICSIDRP